MVLRFVSIEHHIGDIGIKIIIGIMPFSMFQSVVSHVEVWIVENLEIMVIY